jgi:hypothetical protein
MVDTDNVRLDAYTIRVALDCDRVLRRAQFVRACVEELLRRPYRRSSLALVPGVSSEDEMKQLAGAGNGNGQRS